MPVAVPTHTLLSDTLHKADTSGIIGVTCTSLFEGNALKPHHPSAVFKNGEDLIWPALVLFAAFAMVVFARVSEPRKLAKVFTAFYSLQASRQLQREDYKLGKRLSVVLLLVFMVSLSFFIYKLNAYFGLMLEGKSDLQQFLFFNGVVVGVYSVKYLVSLAVAVVLDSTELIKEYLFNVSVFSQVVGIVLLPFVVILQFSRLQAEWFIYPALIIVVSVYLFRLVRGFSISGLEQGVGFFYIFLYLCALEILPLLVLVKFLVTSF